MLPRVDRARPDGGMLPPTQADIDRTAALAARYRSLKTISPMTLVKPIDEVKNHE